MWFVGALVGAVVGAVTLGVPGFFLGAVIGGLAVGAFSARNTDRIVALERRVAALEAARESTSVSEPEPEPEPQAAPESEPESPEPVMTRFGPIPRAPAPESDSAPEPAPAPQVEAGPSWWDKLASGNVVAKVGVLVLFFGIAFLLKYFYERIHVPIELRLTAVALGALALVALGWRLRESRPGYALALQGGGIGVLYLVIFGAFRLFGVLPGALAFPLLAGVSAASAGLAIAQNSLTLAVMGVSGGFLAPILASTGRGSHVMLFSYYAVLNAGIVVIAWAKAWRVLNVLGFAFTAGVGLLWGTQAYRPELLASTEPFILLFFAMYLLIPILFARRRAIELKDTVDGTLVFGVPMVGFGLQAAAVSHIEYAAAWSALFFAAVYLALAMALFRRAGESLRLLVESFVALSLAFATLAIPLAFEGRLTSAAWALEGAAVVWIATRQGRLLARIFGYLLQPAAAVAFLSDVGRGSGSTPVLNSFYLGAVFLALAALFIAAYLERNRERVHEAERQLPYLFVAWGALWWYGGAMHEIARHVAWDYRTQAMLAFFAASSVGFSLVAAAARAPTLRWLWLALYPAMVMQAGLEYLRGVHPFAHLGAPVWVGAFAVHLWLLARHVADRPALAEHLHAVGVWLLAIVGAHEVGWQIDAAVDGRRVWPAIAWAIVPAAILLALVSRPVQARWPVAAFPRSYVVHGGAPLAVFLALWVLAVNFASSGDPYPLPYLPLLNPLDIAIAAVFLALAWWLAELPRHGLEAWWQAARVPVFTAFGAAGFLWVNAILLRTLHHWAGLPFALQPMLSSFLVQAAFSILWTLLALGAMMVATRLAQRFLWITGAALMGVVVAKLFLVDLSGVGTVERIVSFIGVGLLMLLIGYLSPVPPRPTAAAAS